MSSRSYLQIKERVVVCNHAVQDPPTVAQQTPITVNEHEPSNARTVN